MKKKSDTVPVENRLDLIMSVKRCNNQQLPSSDSILETPDTPISLLISLPKPQRLLILSLSLFPPSMFSFETQTLMIIFSSLSSLYHLRMLNSSCRPQWGEGEIDSWRERVGKKKGRAAPFLRLGSIGVISEIHSEI